MSNHNRPRNREKRTSKPYLENGVKITIRLTREENAVLQDVMSKSNYSPEEIFLEGLYELAV